MTEKGLDGLALWVLVMLLLALTVLLEMTVLVK